MRQYIILGLILFTTTVFAQVKINCPPKTKLKRDGNLGYLNFGGVNLGDIYVLKLSGDKIKRMRPLGSKTVDPSNISKGAVTQLRQQKVAIDFVLQASAEIDPSLKAELKNQLSRALDFNLYNSFPNLIKNPTDQIDVYNPNVFKIKSGEVYALINRITIVDSLVVKTDTGLDIDASAKVRVGQYDVQIVNNCSGLLRIKGKEVPAYFDFLVFTPTITTVTQQVVGILEAKSVKVKKVVWKQVTDREFTLADDFEIK